MNLQPPEGRLSRPAPDPKQLHRIPLRIPVESAAEFAFLANLHGRSINAELVAATQAWVATYREEIDTMSEELARLQEEIQEPLARLQEAVARHNAAASLMGAKLFSAGGESKNTRPRRPIGARFLT